MSSSSQPPSTAFLNSHQQIVYAASIWEQLLALQNKKQNQLLISQPDDAARNYCFCIDGQQSFSSMLLNEQTNVLNADKQDIKSFYLFASRKQAAQQDKYMSSKQKQSQVLYLGFPVFKVYRDNRLYYGSLFNLAIDNLSAEGDSFFFDLKKPLAINDYEVDYAAASLAHLHIGSYLLNDVLGKDLDKDYSPIVDRSELLQFFERQLHCWGIKISKKKLANISVTDFCHFLTQEFSKIVDEPYEVVEGPIFFWDEGLWAYHNLQSDLKELTDKKFWDKLAKNYPDNPGYLFWQGKKQSSANAELPLPTSILNEKLSPSQQQIAKQAVLSNLSFATGPPGVGKSYLLKNLADYFFCNHILSLANSESSKLPIPVLIVSFNNLAVDQALSWEKPTENFLQQMPYSLRLGNKEVLYNQTLPYIQYLINFIVQDEQSIDNIAEQYRLINQALRQINVDNTNWHDLLALCKKAHHYFVLLNKDKVLKLLKSIQWAIVNEQRLRSLFVKENLSFFGQIFPVMGTTLLSVKAIFPKLQPVVENILVDEAGQAKVMEMLPLLLRANSSLLVGDSWQHQPIIDIIDDDWLQHAKSLAIEDLQLVKNKYFFPTKTKPLSAHDLGRLQQIDDLSLQEHYRCHPDIINFCISLCDYKMKSVSKIDLDIMPLKYGVYWYYDLTEGEQKSGSSWINEQEAAIIVSLLNWLSTAITTASTIAVLTPYKPQQELLNAQLQAAITKPQLAFTNTQKLESIINRVQISTIHAYQGQESDIVIFSPTITNIRPYFLNKNRNMLNVLVSRAIKHLIVVGSIDNLKRGRYSKKLAELIVEKGSNITTLVGDILNTINDNASG